MTKSELIEKLEKEIAVNSEIICHDKTESNKILWYTATNKAISSILKDLKNLNGETVKRQELIDCARAYLDYQSIGNAAKLNKSIEENEN
jgi:hypothetical protein